jgi:beta-lactamase regulating signal transducer with metallopeptidase domain
VARLLVKPARALARLAGERNLLAVGVVWLALVVALLVMLGRSVIPAAIAACRQACSAHPGLVALQHQAPLYGVLLLSVLLLGGVAYASARAARQWQITSRALTPLLSAARTPSRKVRQASDPLELGDALVYVRDERPLAFCHGFFSPRILISTGLVRSLSVRELRAVLRHEQYHMVRRDPLRLVLASALADVFFYLPLLKTLRLRHAITLELSADDSVLAREPVSALAGALLKSIRSTYALPEAFSAVAFGGTAARIRRLTGSGGGLPQVPLFHLAVSLIVGGALLLGSVTAVYAVSPASSASCCTDSPCATTD